MDSDADRQVHTRLDSMAPEIAERFAAVLDVPRTFRPGDEVPLPWHWAYFTDIAAQSDLAPDGHPRRQDAMTERYPRRMAASGSVHRLGALLVGRPAERRSHLEDITEKQGRSGPLLFATWRHAIEQEGQVVLEEQQTVVYREPPAGSAQTDKTVGENQKGANEDKVGPGPRRSVTFDSTMLFRFSALTWNAHRIHYDWPYATGTEGYPGLVVHAPLLAAVLALEASRELGELGHVEFRAQAPVFVDDLIEVFGESSRPGSFSAEARRADGTIALSLVADARH